MFCYQCEQAAKGIGCSTVGICGKKPEVSALQDLLEYTLKGLSLYAVEGRKVGVTDRATNVFTVEALFSTLTNVDFDPARFETLIRQAIAYRDAMKEQVAKAGGKVDFDHDAATYTLPASVESMAAKGETVGIKDPTANEDIESLIHIIMYGLKGVAAYADHALILGQEDDVVYAFVQEALASMLDKSLTLEDRLGMALKTGEVNLRAMELLDAGNTGTYGHPVPTPVSLGAKKGKAILVSGHDLMDLENILKQTEGTGISVYTHGEMLPAHGYPSLKKYSHLAGHYGTAWQNQHTEFAAFPGAIVMTTNCIQKPHDEYKDNIFTRGLVGWPGVTHIADQDYSAVISRAQDLPGFEADVPGKTVMTGFARNAVLGVADKVVDAVKTGAVRHFFLVGGCDGYKHGRSYYTEFVQKVPKDCMVLTLACGKFRFFDQDMGDIGGIPRLLDVGQCNDAYSAIKIAVALSEAFGVGVNELPLSLVLSWYEQKAVAILLTLLHLGIKDIRLGPSLPAFITPNVLNVLVETYGVKPITTPENDLRTILGCEEGEEDCLETALAAA